MVLVASESRASGESLLAIRIRALVRPLTRMYPTMPSQRTAVTEGLSTTLTHVRLLSSVDTLVDGQGRPLDELLAAVGVVADMRPHSGVNSLMASKIAPSCKSLSTGAARVGLGWRLRGLRLWRLRKLRHGVGDVGSHSGEANRRHVGLRHVERCMHCARRAIGSSVLHVAVHRGLGVSRVLGSVRRVGTVHGKLRKLLEGRVFWVCSLHIWHRLCCCLSAGLLVQHVCDAHNFTGSWRGHD